MSKKTQCQLRFAKTPLVPRAVLNPFPRRSRERGFKGALPPYLDDDELLDDELLDDDELSQQQSLKHPQLPPHPPPQHARPA